MDLENELSEQERTLQEYLEKRVKENFIESLQNYVDKIKEDVNNPEIRLQEHMSIDRIEGEIAVCELSDGTMMEIMKKEFPYEIKEGDIIKVEFTYEQQRQGHMKILEKDEQERLRRIQLIKEKMEQIKKLNN